VTTDGHSSSRAGFVLPAAMAIVLAVGIVLGGLLGYVGHTARLTRLHIARTRCRLAAQSAIERAKTQVQTAFSKYTAGASVKVGPYSSTAYDWFDAVSSDRRTIGAGYSVTVTLSAPVTHDGIRVYIAVGDSPEHANGKSYAYLPLVATGEYVYPDGLRATATVQEFVCFATGQSQVFNYAYFVNNYGWMSGSGITINGDMRANGNVSLSGSVVNGFIYAAVNDELGVDGAVSLSSSPKIYSQTYYRQKAGTSARPDRGDYDIEGAFDAPSGSSYTTIQKPSSRSAGTLSSSGAAIVNEGVDPVAMPFVSELSEYVTYANEQKGTLTAPAYSYTDSAGANHAVSAKTVQAHYTGAGPSGDPSLADAGALVLIGTRTNPIKLNGPVVVDSDVIIKGYVSGQGTVYSGRNIHIIGSIQYVDAPTWGHQDADDAATAAANDAKDRLGLVAKGNIVLGDSSSSSWHSSVDSYINGGSSSVVEKYACDASDADIGYPSTFQGSYTAKEYVAGAGSDGSGYFDKVRVTTVGLGTYHTETVTERVRSGYYWKTVTKQVQVEDTETRLVNSPDRRYYETVCDDKILSSLKDSGIGRVDAVLYNNHGIFGTIGSGSSAFQLNGAIVCRDEGLIATAGNGINFNWDFRLMESPDPETLGLPVGPREPYTYAWQEVPDDLNAAWRAEHEGGTR